MILNSLNCISKQFMGLSFLSMISKYIMNLSKSQPLNLVAPVQTYSSNEPLASKYSKVLY